MCYLRPDTPHQSCRDLLRAKPPPSCGRQGTTSSDYIVAKTLQLAVFFFQAEDGIRHKLVTGVQTCALPISSIGPSPNFATASSRSSTPPFERSFIASPRAQAYSEKSSSPPRARSTPLFVPRHSQASETRSEERRIGKECRSGRSPHQEKEKR